MPKATHFHTTRDVAVTDKKTRPDDDRIYAKDKQEFQESEREKKSEPRSEEEFVSEQDKNGEISSNGAE